MKKSVSKKQIAKIIEISKTVILTLLVVSLIVLVVIYINGMHIYQKMTAHDDIGNIFDRLWSVQSGEEPTGLDKSRLFPQFIGYRKSEREEPRGCIADATAIEELYSAVTPCIKELFGDDAVCHELSAENGVKIFEAARENDRFVYIRYHVPVLYQIIYSYCAEELSVLPDDIASGEMGNIGAYVREMIIIPDSENDSRGYVAYAYDGNDRYYEFRLREPIANSDFSIVRLADIGGSLGLSRFSFFEDDLLKTALPIIEGEPECPVISANDTSIENEETLNAILRLFGYNPDKLDWYSDNGANVYIDSHSQLRLGKGELVFITTDERASSFEELRGPGIDSLLGYTGNNTPTLLDKLTAADNLIRRFSELPGILAEEPAAICLGDVYMDGDILKVEYFLTYNGIRISDEPFLSIDLTDTTVSGVRLRLCNVTDSGAAVPALPQKYVLDSFILTGALAENSFITSLDLMYVGGNAKWIAEVKN